MEYYISEKSERMENITESHLVELPVYQDIPLNRYERLTQMVEAVQDGDVARLQEQMKQYQAYDSLAARLFRVI